MFPSGFSYLWTDRELAGLFNLVHEACTRWAKGVREHPEATRVSFNTLLAAAYTHASLA